MGHLYRLVRICLLYSPDQASLGCWYGFLFHRVSIVLHCLGVTLLFALAT